MLAGTKPSRGGRGGLYQVGSFVGDHREVERRFMDDVRAFVKSNSGMADIIVAWPFGSPDIFGFEERGPDQSINLVTCHDGFTLIDLVLYNEKKTTWRMARPIAMVTTTTLSWEPRCGRAD